MSNDFALRVFERYNVDNDDIGTYMNNRILTFRLDPKGNITSKLNGKIVFIKDGHAYDVMNGETWICKVIDDMMGHFIAKPLMRLDEDFFFNIVSEEVDILADIVWEKHRNIIQKQIDERSDEYIQSKVNEKLKEQTLTVQREYEERIAELEKQLRDQQTTADPPMDEEKEKDPSVKEISVRRYGANTIRSNFFDDETEVSQVTTFIY